MPLRDAFGALFFFSFGLAIDPSEFGKVVGPALAAIAMSAVLAMVAGATAARINHFDREGAANIAFSVLARGEFALILVTLAIAAGLDERLVPFAGIYVLTLALASPILASNAHRIARLVPERWFPATAEDAVRA
jgi:CPA2 family monovalent cation:H+ antiporter-2